jgi:alkaline phosphatase D
MRIIPLLLLACFPLSLAAAEDDYSTNHVTHGPMLGQVTENSVKVWARTHKAGDFTVRYGLAPDQLDQTSDVVTTRVEQDHTGWTTLTQLKPQTAYHYQVYIGLVPSGPAGTFRTLPGAAAHRDPVHNPRGRFNFRFQFGSCANQNPKGGIGPSLPAYATMLRELQGDALFSIMNGDFIYEEHRSMPVDDWRRQVGLTPPQTPRIVQLAPNVVGMWENYKSYLSRGVNLAAWQRHHRLSRAAGGLPRYRRSRVAGLRRLGESVCDAAGRAFRPGHSHAGERHSGRRGGGFHPTRSEAGGKPACPLGHADRR